MKMIEWLRANEQPTVYVMTKSDKLSRSKRAAAVQKFSRALGTTREDPPIPYSSISGAGRTDLLPRICPLYTYDAAAEHRALGVRSSASMHPNV